MKSFENGMHCGVVVAALVLLIATGNPGRAYAAGLRLNNEAKKELASVRFVGRAPRPAVTSFGANYESYVAALQSGHNDDVVFVKLVYRFLSYDSGLPASLLDYDIVHRFRVMRQPDCDDVAENIMYSDRLATSGGAPARDFSFVFAKHASGVAIPEATILPCYVVSPADYKGSRSFPAAVPNSVALEKEQGAAGASRGRRP